MDTLVGILRGIYRLGSFVEGFGAYLPSGSFRVTVTDFKLFAMTSGFRDFENPKLFSWAITVRREALSNRLEGAENGIRPSASTVRVDLPTGGNAIFTDWLSF
jgi:hypothetical protein